MNTTKSIVKACVFWMMYNMTLYFLLWDTDKALPLIFGNEIGPHDIVLSIVQAILAGLVPLYFFNKSFDLLKKIGKHPLLVLAVILILIFAEKQMDAIVANGIKDLSWHSYAKELYDLLCIAIHFLIIGCFLVKTSDEQSIDSSKAVENRA